MTAGLSDNSACPLCGDSKAAASVAGRDLLHDTPGIFTIIECFSCGLWRLKGGAQIDDRDIYPADYKAYSDVRQIQKVKNPSLSHRLRKHYFKWLSGGRLNIFHLPISKVLPLLGAKAMSFTSMYKFNPFAFTGNKKKVLDIGCADGHFLSEMAALGWSPFGVEQNDTAADRAKERGIYVFTGDFIAQKKLDDYRDRFDLITMRQTLEHFFDPGMVLKKVMKLLKPGGFIAVWLPVRGGLVQKAFGQWWYNLDLPRHKVIFNTATLKSMFRQCGFDIIQMKWYTSTKSITGSLDHRKKTKGGLVSGNNSAVKLLARPLVKVLDFFRIGDNVLLIAKKPDGQHG